MAPSTTPRRDSFHATLAACTKPGPKRFPRDQAAPMVEYRAVEFRGAEETKAYAAEAKARGLVKSRWPSVTVPASLPNFTAAPRHPDEARYLGAQVRFRPSSCSMEVADKGGPLEPVQVDAHGKTEGWVVSLAPATRHVWVRSGRRFYSVHLDALVPNEVRPFRAEEVLV
jgi:hypothetical protein